MMRFIVFLLFFFAATVIPSSVSMASAYFDDCITMNKVSNDKLICISHDTLQKLIDRDYAYVEHDWQRICDNNTNSTGSCNFIRNDDTLCVYVVADPDECIEQYNNPKDCDKCFNIFKLIVRHPVSVTSPHVDYFYADQDEFENFAFFYCGIESTRIQDTYDYDAIISKITAHALFVKNYGITDSIVYDAKRSMDENSSRNTYGTGYFLSPNGEKHNFEFTFHPIVFNFSLTD